MSDATIPPDTKDWTWVLTRECPECHESVGQIEVAQMPAIIRDTVPRWRTALAAPDATVRPAATVWSPLEYGAHVRDVESVFLARLRLMLGEDGARFADWDQDAAAVQGGYAGLDPSEVAHDLETGAEELAAAVEALTPEQEERRGVRSNGSHFTVRTLLQYFLHDTLHHLHDVKA